MKKSTHLVSLNNGITFFSAHEAMKRITPSVWEALYYCMDDEARETVHAELAPCTDEMFLERYLELAPCDLIYG